MRVSFTVEVDGPQGRYVLRAEPHNIPQGFWGLTNWARSNAFVGRVLFRNHAWTVRVRARADDPFGTAVYEETVPDRAAARDALARVERSIRAGQLPLRT